MTAQEGDENRRTLLIGGVGAVKGRVREAGPVMLELCDEFEPVLRRIGFLEGAPFRTVSLIIRFGTEERLEPEIGRINRQHAELPVSIELPMAVLRRATRDELKSYFRRATNQVLAHVAREIGLEWREVIGP